MQKAIFPILLAALCLFAPRASQAGEVMNWKVDGVTREALVFPASKASDTGKAPVLFAFHGHGGNMRETANGAQFQEVWPEAIVVYMQGLPTRISGEPLGLYPGWQRSPGENGNRDLKFLDAVLATLRTKFAVDERRIYATGFSNGAIFTYLLWDTRANTFAAFAAVAGDIATGVHLNEPKPFLQIAGERDNVVPFAEQRRSIQAARELDGSGGDGQSCGKYCTMYPSSKGAPVETYIHPGGHVWPRESSRIIVNFLKNYSQAP